MGSVKEPPHSASTVLVGKVLQKMWRVSGKRIALERVSEPGPWKQLVFCITYWRGGGAYFSYFQCTTSNEARVIYSHTRNVPGEKVPTFWCRACQVVAVLG